MSYPTLALVAFIVLFTGYLVLAGIDYGVGLALPRTGSDAPGRRAVLGAVGPLLLGNEAWLLVSIGALAGTLPGLRGALVDGAYPYALIAFAGALVLNAGIQLRGRHPGERVRRAFDLLICAAGAAAAFGWGCFLAVTAAGVSLGGDGHVRGVAAPDLFTLLGGLTMVALLGTHGSAFLAARLTGAPARRAAALTGIGAMLAAALLAVTALTGWVGGRSTGAVADALRHPVLAALAVVLAVGALLFARSLAGSGRARLAPWATTAAVIAAAGAVFAGKYPALLTSTVAGVPAPTAAQLATDQTALAAVIWTSGPVLLIVVAAQVYMWLVLWAPARTTPAPATPASETLDAPAFS
ncbi:cytochrome d ubiquinol oxidase subunit II (plasmid) [Streptomyces sp. NBC_00536]|uniref:cytochrome d ubiquinol oxidase subunit II n=1 Tax=Streptomyces sp. NBC_00536 TaxID=2975769 RepID=UPI002E81AB99|nr:cytochrome d ubiquinol oxidase subunit II [Streptomyces sp. NBC_00536]WUC84225.1 cytochrome d ubiquinol oxidase subunit II [Streptomyces sp. NBC_00536]